MLIQDDVLVIIQVLVTGVTWVSVVDSIEQSTYRGI